MFHENNRNDRDNYIKIKTANLKTPCTGVTQKFKGAELVKVGFYDYKSIMHYAAKHCSINGKNTMVPLQPMDGYTLGDNVLVNATLTDADASFAREIYGSP